MIGGRGLGKKGIKKKKKKMQGAADGAARMKLQMFKYFCWPESYPI